MSGRSRSVRVRPPDGSIPANAESGDRGSVGEIGVARPGVFQIIREHQQGRQPHRLVYGENGVTPATGNRQLALAVERPV